MENAVIPSCDLISVCSLSFYHLKPLKVAEQPENQWEAEIPH